MKKKIILSIILVFLMCITSMLIGSSYAFYEYVSTNNATSFTAKTNNVEDIDIIFEQNNTISTTTALPILDEDRENYATSNSFSVTLGESLYKKDVALEVNLVDINISEELVSEDLKYEVLMNGTSMILSDFSKYKDNQLELLPMTKLQDIQTLNGIYSFEVRVWLSETNKDQSDLMNKNLSGKIEINSMVRK